MIITKNKSNYQDLLKTLAIIAMSIDHVGLYLYPELTVMRIIGRTAMPIFCFFAGYNFHDKPKTRIIICGVLLQIYTTVLFKQFLTTHILISIYLGQWYIYYFRNSLTRFFYSGYYHVVIMVILWYISWALIDYGTLVIAIMILGFIAKHEQVNLKLCGFVAIFASLVHSTLFTLAIPFSDFNFSNTDLILNLTFLTITYILMILSDYSQKIPINLKWISRNVIYIYCIQIIILQFIFIYKYTYGFKNW
ncbi:TraX family protein [Rickettsia australis]|uniref:F pilin acetylation protein TraX n=1 Tax=Rickettsia australis (strain Cutlack) TaxID=1105110 RepID=H8K6X5_RICAC|nr:TraX family protein [Rickettsia australis]AFC71018.1 F pilin acetylation protein TraX [Rickettsia australis str. Cutlack]